VVLRTTRHKIGHFGDVLSSQSLGVVLTSSETKRVCTYTSAVSVCHYSKQILIMTYFFCCINILSGWLVNVSDA